MPADDYVNGGHDTALFELKRPGWQGKANCHPDVIPHVWQVYGDHPVDLFYPPADMRTMTQAQRDAVAQVCDGCPVRAECESWALEHEDHGWWAGIGPELRRDVRRELGTSVARPEVDPVSQRIIGTWIPPQHGSQARYAQHRREGTKPCELCVKAHTAEATPRAAARWARIKTTETAEEREVRQIKARKEHQDARARARKGF